MCIMCAFFRYIRLLDAPSSTRNLRFSLLKFMNLHPLIADLLMLLQLGIKICRIQLASEDQDDP